MPTARQFRYWLTKEAGLGEGYARARQLWADTWAERIMDISFNPKGGAVDEKGNVILDHALIGLLKLQTDNAKWLVGKYAPRMYGDRADAETPLAIQSVTRIERVIVKHEPLGLPYTPPDVSGLEPEQWALLRQVLDLIDRTVGVQSPNEVFGCIRDALLSHFSGQAETSSA